jgi:ligand-binding sensor domain-containing protein
MSLQRYILFLLISLGLCQNGRAQDFRFTRFSTREGLPSNTVYATMQDQDGYIWMATEFGVSRFDGYEFQNFDQEDGLSDNDVFKIFQDSKKRIWFLMSNGTVSYYLNGKIYNKETDRNLQKLTCKSYFNGFLEDHEGNLWFTSLTEGVFRVSPSWDFRHYRPLVDIPTTQLTPGIWQSPEHEVKVGGKGGIINLSRNPGLFETPFKTEYFAIDYIFGKKDGSVLLASNKRLFISSGPGEKFRKVDSSVFQYDRVVTVMTEDPDGDLWIPTLYGLHRFEFSTLDALHHHHYFKSNSVSGIMVDRQNNLWISTLNEGVLLVNDRSVLHFDHSQGLAEIQVNVLHKGTEGVWYGNDRGGLGLIENGKIKVIPQWSSEFFFGRGRFRTFKYDLNKDFLWGVSENGLFAIRDKKIYSHFPMGSKGICFDDSNHVIVGTSYNAVRYNLESVKKVMEEIRKIYSSRKNPKDRVPEFIRKADLGKELLLPTTRVYRIKSDKEQTLWFATNSGLYSRQYGKVLYHKPFDEMLGKSFQNLEILGDGSIVLGCNGYGIIVVKNRTVNIIDRRMGLSSNYIKSLHLFGNDSLWACTPNGLNLIVFRAGVNKPSIQTWTEETGLVSEDLSDIAFSHDTAYISSTAGISVYPNFGKRETFSSPPVHLKELRIDGKSIPVRDLLEVSHTHPSILLSFINLDFKHYGRLHYRYRLKNDQEWIAIPSNEILLSGLNSGNYDVELQVRLPLGTWAKTNKLLRIRVKRPLYENPIFVLLFSVVTVTLLLFFWYLRKAKPYQERKKEQYSRSVESWKEEQAGFVLSALASIQKMVSTNQNENSILFISRFRTFFTRYIARGKEEFQSLENEINLLRNYLEVLQVQTGTLIEISEDPTVKNRAPEIKIPSLILVKTLDLTFSFMRASHFPTENTRIAIAEIGRMIQFTIELKQEIESMSIPENVQKNYLSRRRYLENLVQDWNGIQKKKLEIFAPDIENNKLKTNRFQVWIY